MPCLAIVAGLTAFALSAFASNAVLHELSTRHPRRTENGVHLPIYRRGSPTLRRRDGQTGTIGLGDDSDLSYNVIMTVGNSTTSVVLDTGSSDLWVISDACVSNCSAQAGIPLYPKAAFQPTGLDVRLDYGDSKTGTHASGPIGKDTVALAGLSLPNQYFAAINDTNTSVTDSGSAGIFGLGFPINSAILTTVLNASGTTPTPASKRHNEDVPFNPVMKPILNLAKHVLPHNFNRRAFSSRSKLLSYQPQPRQKSGGASSPALTASILQLYPSTGPFLSRLVAAHSLAAPMFTVTLQRDEVDISGNVGLLSIGELPSGVQNNSLTWVPVRAYTPAQGGLSGPPDAPDEVYPMAWEVMIEDVFLDGQKLSPSMLSPNISPSALIDTGNSIIRGPPDVLKAIDTSLGSTFPCETPHTLAFQIGGKVFPVDPRDFITQVNTNSVSLCSANLASTDTPVEGQGNLNNWSLGDPFLKSVLSSYYYGNLSYPSQDPSRVGFLSTVPADADDKLRAAVKAASNNGGNFASTKEAAPTGVPTALTTNSNGLPAARATPTASAVGSKGNANGVSPSTVPLCNRWLVVLLAGVVAWRSLI